MNEKEKWDFIINLDEEILKGGVILFEWTTFLAKDAEVAFCKGANLSAILTCQAAIESHLRYESELVEDKKYCFHDLIERSELNKDLKVELHKLRIFRNRWVHVKNPQDDEQLLNNPEFLENELEQMSIYAIKVMLKTLYSSQFI